MKSRLVGMFCIYVQKMLLIGLLFAVHGVHAMTCNPCLSSVGESVWTQLDRLLATQCVGTTIRQSDVPFTITEPGIYSLCEDLRSVSPAPVINITGDNVLLNLACHSIIVTQSSMTSVGVGVSGDRVVVRNGSLVASEGDAGLSPIFLLNIIGTHGGVIEDLSFSGTSDPINSFNIGSAGVRVVNSTNLVVSDCTFQNISVGATIITSTQIIVADCKFENTTQAAFFPGAMSAGITCDHCQFTGGRFSRISGGDNVTLCRFVGVRSTLGLSAVTIDAADGSQDVVVRDCEINGTEFPGEIGIEVVPAIAGPGVVTGVILENCMVNNTDGHGMSITGTNIVVRSCTVNSAGGSGIIVAGSSFNVFVQNCEAANSIGANFVIPAPITITSGEAAIPGSNYWMNVSLPA